MAESPENRVYAKLVESADDALGALAYALYKQRKIDYITQYTSDKGHAPSSADLEEFRRFSNLQETLQMYREQANLLLQGFMRDAMTDQLECEKDKLLESQVSARLDQSEKQVLTKFEQLDTAVTSKLDQSSVSVRAEIEKLLQARQSDSGWRGLAKATGVNFLVNVLTVVVVGLAVLGLGAMDNITAKAKLLTAEPAKPTAPASGKSSEVINVETAVSIPASAAPNALDAKVDDTHH